MDHRQAATSYTCPVDRIVATAMELADDVPISAVSHVINADGTAHVLLVIAGPRERVQAREAAWAANGARAA